jgi:hypothetical protein
MITIPYYEMFTPDEQELDTLNKAGVEANKAGFRFHAQKWYRKIGMIGVSLPVFQESREQPLTLEDIKEWERVKTQDEPL